MSRGRHVRKKSASSRVRAALPVAALMLGSAAAFLALGATPVASAATNPVRPAAVSSHGFGVLVEHDATLLSNESETGVAIGGTLTFGDYRVIDKDTGAYTATGDGAPTALVASAVDWAGSHGVLQVNQSMGAKIGGTYDVKTTNANAPRLVSSGAGFDSVPRVDVTASVSSVSPTGPSGFDLPQLFASYRSSSDDLASLTDTGVLRNDAGTGPWVAGNARLVLAAGQNVLTVTPAQLAALGSVNPGGGASLGSGTYLIINVVGSGNLTLGGPTAALAYAGGQNPQTHVLLNLTTTGTVTVDGNDQLEGTLFAPRARVLDDNGKNIEGDVVVESLHQSGGEVHGFHFAHDVDVPPTTPSTSTSASTSASTATVTATVTQTAPGTTTTVTQTAPGTTETVTAPGTTTTVTETAPGTTETVTAPGTTDTVTAPGTTETVTAPGTTETVTAPGTTETVTAPGTTETVTAPGTTETVTAPGTTETVTAPGTTDTVTAPGGTDTVAAPTVTRIVVVPSTAAAPTVTRIVVVPGRDTTVTAPVDGVSTSSPSRNASTGRAATSSSRAVAGQSASRITPRVIGPSSGSSEPGLANTGVQIGSTVAIGLALLVGGAGLLMLTTRAGRRQH